MIPARVDAVVAGGGLSGLSLVAHLAAAGWGDRNVLLVDDPAAGAPATCWGSWTPGTGLLDHAACQTFDALRTHAGGRSAVLPLRRYRYHVVRRDDLARAVAGIIDGYPGFTIHKGRVEAIRKDASGVDVVIDGQTVRTDWVFDSVGTSAQRAPADALMAFTGWEVRCADPVFDPHVPVLFDFRTPQPVGARFVYVLPASPFRALVEVTDFVPRHGKPASPRDRSEALTGYLAGVLHCGDFEVVRTEAAVLPLRVAPPDRVCGRSHGRKKGTGRGEGTGDGEGKGKGRVVAIGARAGLIKASTGYAYQRIQRDSQAIAASMVRHGHPYDVPAPRWRHRMLDALLLAVLDREPGQLEQAFARLFERLDADTVLRFLDEDTNLVQELAVMASVRPQPFLRALATGGFRTPGSGAPGLRRRACGPG